MRQSGGRLALCAIAGLALASGAAMAAEVTFQLNDALVKDQPLAGVAIQVSTGEAGAHAVKGSTDASGRDVFELNPGEYFASYALAGYVPIENSPFRVEDSAKLITTTMSMLLEAEAGGPAHRIRIILNWGSNESDHIRDADAHFLCTREDPPTNISFSLDHHVESDHEVSLDVDDIDWGGPETITVSDPMPGIYYYWVHKCRKNDNDLGRSEIIVRVLIDDKIAGEYPIPQSIRERSWRPFKELVVDRGGNVTIVDFPLAERQLASTELPTGARNPGLAAHVIPTSVDVDDDSNDDDSNDGLGIFLGGLGFALPFIIIVWLVVRRRSAR